MPVIAAVSDLHGELPKECPEADFLVVAGDICPGGYKVPIIYQSSWLYKAFFPWIEGIPVKHVVACWGNHDWIGEPKPDYTPPTHPKLTMLTDQRAVIDGLKFWGSPWQLPFYEWAFNAPEEELAKKYEAIPEDTDIIVSHGPPHGYGDLAPSVPIEHEYPAPRRTGSKSFLNRIKAVRPKLVVCGHIHPGYGKYHCEDTIILNASFLDNTYKPVNPIQVVKI